MIERELIFLHHGFYPRCRARLDKHFHDYHCLQLMTRGAVDLWYDQQHHLMTGGWLWPAYPGPRIRFHSHNGRPWPHRYLAFKGPLVHHWRDQGLLPTEPRRVTKTMDFTHRFDRLRRHLRDNQAWDHHFAVNLLERMLLELARHHVPPSPSTPWLNELLQKLNDADPPLDYTAIAEQMGMSLSTLRRRFRAATGLSLHTHVIQCRAARARRLLGETDLPVKAIADRLGYRDIYYFSRQFHAVAGISPTAYRRTRQPG